MNNSSTKKIAILSIMLIFPLFIFGFLKIFGENEFTPLPVLSPETASGCATVSKTAYTVPDFKLFNSKGEVLTQQSFSGEPYVAVFVDIQCASRECTEVGLSLYRIQERFKSGQSIKIVAHTANPDMDTPEVLQAYATRLKADPQQWYMATGDKRVLSELARCGYGLVDNAVLADSPTVALIDGQGQIRGYYDASDREDVNRLLTECSLLLLHSGKK